MLWISISSLYYHHEWREEELEIMGKIDEIYTEDPCYWARRISAELKRQWYKIGKKKVKKYMREMRISAVYPKRNTSIPNKSHKKYPYLLRGKEVSRPNEVRSTDITYIKLPGGFVYLLAIMDRYSRKIIAWDISPSMDKEFCCGVLRKALSLGIPEIFNMDQGSQFTSQEFLELLEKEWIKISMDGVGRCFDNIRMERLWRTLKYEDIHLHDYQTPIELYHGLSLYIERYNNRRLHSSLGNRTPSEVYGW